MREKMPGNSSSFRQGEVLLLELPFTDYLGKKLRPVLVVSSEELNRISNDLIVLKITGSSHFEEFQVELDRGGLLRGKLKKKRFIDCSSVFTVEKPLIIKSIGEVCPEKMGEVKETLKRALGIY
ncbi:type II toxin-antitoxin system PemK/MazF family toxin [Thermococcus sp.]|uniref:type II toxin-antitoxin system PemK/MazF family toxin n=1 Tax=Thermococcus sp. TaxID=35749 RepID=UPI00260F7F07|nr:type II toxin-antitoxin system PemK/MazF family toxin [Thermococcus sp.]